MYSISCKRITEELEIEEHGYAVDCGLREEELGFLSLIQTAKMEPKFINFYNLLVQNCLTEYVINKLSKAGFGSIKSFHIVANKAHKTEQEKKMLSVLLCILQL